MTWGILRPAIVKSSRTESNTAESLPLWSMMGVIAANSSPMIFDDIKPSRARCRLILPRSVLNSPLCAM